MCVSFYHTTDIKCSKTALPVGLSLPVAVALFWFNTFTDNPLFGFTTYLNGYMHNLNDWLESGGVLFALEMCIV